MTKPLSVLIRLVGTALLVITIAAGYLVYSWGKPIKAFEITSGQAGVFLIGETQESLLTRLPNQTYSPQPKHATCPVNWIEVKAMSPTQKQCLLNTNEWEVGSGLEELCPEKTDFFATLLFTGNKLARVAVRCTTPE